MIPARVLQRNNHVLEDGADIAAIAAAVAATAAACTRNADVAAAAHANLFPWRSAWLCNE